MISLSEIIKNMYGIDIEKEGYHNSWPPPTIPSSSIPSSELENDCLPDELFKIELDDE